MYQMPTYGHVRYKKIYSTNNLFQNNDYREIPSQNFVRETKGKLLKTACISIAQRCQHTL